MRTLAVQRNSEVFAIPPILYETRTGVGVCHRRGIWLGGCVCPPMTVMREVRGEEWEGVVGWGGWSGRERLLSGRGPSHSILEASA